MASVTASVRLAAPSLPSSEPTWNLAVCSLMPNSRAIALLGRPAATSCSTSCSRAVSVLALRRLASAGVDARRSGHGGVEHDETGRGGPDRRGQRRRVDVAGEIGDRSAGKARTVGRGVRADHDQRGARERVGDGEDFLGLAGGIVHDNGRRG